MKRIFIAPRQSGKTYAAISEWLRILNKGKVCFITSFNSQALRYIEHAARKKLLLDKGKLRVGSIRSYTTLSKNLINSIVSCNVEKIIFDECMLEYNSPLYGYINNKNIDVDVFFTTVYHPRIKDALEKMIKHNEAEIIYCNRGWVSDYVATYKSPVTINPLPDELFVI